MGFERQFDGSNLWVGPQLPADPDDWVFQVLLGCALSRLLAFEPIDRWGNRAPEDSAMLATELVDRWWSVVEGGDLELGWLERIERAAAPLVGTDNPVGMLLGASRQIFLGSNTRSAWNTAIRETEGALVVMGDWSEKRYPGDIQQGTWVAGKYLPGPMGVEFSQVRAALPALQRLNAELVREAAAATSAEAKQILDELRSNAQQAGAALDKMRRLAGGLRFPGPEASLDEVLAVVASNWS